MEIHGSTQWRSMDLHKGDPNNQIHKDKNLDKNFLNFRVWISIWVDPCITKRSMDIHNGDPRIYMKEIRIIRYVKIKKQIQNSQFQGLDLHLGRSMYNKEIHGSTQWRSMDLHNGDPWIYIKEIQIIRYIKIKIQTKTFSILGFGSPFGQIHV